MKLKEALDCSSDKIKPIDLELLLCHVLGVERVFLYRETDYKLNKSEQKRFLQLVKKLQNGQPLPYITHHKEFFGLDFYVDERVLIPRPETEILVQKALSYIHTLNIFSSRSQLNRKIVLAEIGTGSGCISISITKTLNIENCELKIYATDISQESLRVAKLNAKKHKVLNKITFLAGDLLTPLPEKVDIIIGNLPYVKSTFLKRPSNESCILNWEPEIALNGGRDGLRLIKKLLKQSQKFLKPEGVILLEIDPSQRTPLEKFCGNLFPKGDLKFIKDFAYLDRVILIRPGLAST